jgi:hypothetical protein
MVTQRVLLSELTTWFAVLRQQGRAAPGLQAGHRGEFASVQGGSRNVQQSSRSTESERFERRYFSLSPSEGGAMSVFAQQTVAGSTDTEPGAGPGIDPSSGTDRPRGDVSTIITAVDEATRSLILGPCREALDLVHAFLPAEEEVHALLPTRVNLTAKATTSLLVLTERRVILVSAAPQAVSWPLTSLDHFQFVPGSATHVTSDGAEFMLGADPATTVAGEEFERAVKFASVEAVLRFG